MTTRAPDATNPAPLAARIDGVVASTNVDGDFDTVDPLAYAMDPETVLSGETQLTAAPAPKYPATPTYLGGPQIVHGAGSHTVLPGHYSKFWVAGNSDIYLEPGDYFVDGNFHTFDTAKIHAKGPVRFFVNGIISVNDDSSVNHENDPRDFELVVTGPPNGAGTTGWISEESHLWARVKAPTGTLKISGTVFGEVHAEGLKVNGDPDGSGAVFFFTDLAAAGPGPAGGGTYVYSSTWTVK